MAGAAETKQKKNRTRQRRKRRTAGESELLGLKLERQAELPNLAAAESQAGNTVGAAE
jgi:hypothetical protein